MSPPPDDRIPRYREAAEAMAQGQFHVQVSAGENDDVAKLGQAIVSLGATLERQFAELVTLSRLAEKINAGLLVEEVLNHVFESFRFIIPYDRIGFAFIEDEGRLVRSIWARSTAPEMKISTGYSAALAGSSLEPIIATGQPRIINDLLEHLQQHPDSESTRRIVEEGVRSSLTCPLVVAGKPVGFLFFSSTTPGAYEHAHVELYMRIAGQLSMIVEKGRLYQDLAETKGQLEAANRRLSALASLDGLTGIPNRRALEERLEAAWRRAFRHQTPLSLIMIDIDFFKSFNDKYGHLAGDECLIRVAADLHDRLQRADDYVARYGGEEFLVVAEASTLAGTVALAEKLRARIEGLELRPGGGNLGLRLTISAGVASTVPSAGSSSAQLVAAADRALYLAKAAGRNRVEALPALLATTDCEPLSGTVPQVGSDDSPTTGLPADRDWARSRNPKHSG